MISSSEYNFLDQNMCHFTSLRSDLGSGRAISTINTMVRYTLIRYMVGKAWEILFLPRPYSKYESQGSGTGIRILAKYCDALSFLFYKRDNHFGSNKSSSGYISSWIYQWRGSTVRSRVGLTARAYSSITESTCSYQLIRV